MQDVPIYDPIIFDGQKSYLSPNVTIISEKAFINGYDSLLEKRVYDLGNESLVAVNHETGVPISYYHLLETFFKNYGKEFAVGAFFIELLIGDDDDKPVIRYLLENNLIQKSWIKNSVEYVKNKEGDMGQKAIDMIMSAEKVSVNNFNESTSSDLAKSPILAEILAKQQEEKNKLEAEAEAKKQALIDQQEASDRADSELNDVLNPSTLEEKKFDYNSHEDILTLAVEKGIVEVNNGGWYRFGEIKLGQGQLRAIEGLKESPDIFTAIRTSLVSNDASD
jgi:hypothetical protein